MNNLDATLEQLLIRVGTSFLGLELKPHTDAPSWPASKPLWYAEVPLEGRFEGAIVLRTTPAFLRRASRSLFRLAATDVGVDEERLAPEGAGLFGDGQRSAGGKV